MANNNHTTENCSCDQCCFAAYLQGIAEWNYEQQRMEQWEASLSPEQLVQYEREQRERWLLQREQAKTH